MALASGLSNGGSEGSLLAYVEAWYRSLPLSTKATFTTIVGLWLFEFVTGFGNPHSVCLNPHATLMHCQVWRMLTSVIFHGGLLHVAFNMLAFLPMGMSLERITGTVQFTHLMLVISLVEGLLYITLSYTVFFLGVYPMAISQCAVGLSGVIFGLLVIDNHQAQASQRSIFGLFTVPAHAYPYALLILWQLLMPSASFMGHLCGLLAGQLWVWGYLRPLQLSRSTAAWLESSRVLAALIHSPSFIMMPVAALPYTINDAARHGGANISGAGSSSSGTAGSSFGPSLGSFTRVFGGWQGQGQGQQQRQGIADAEAEGGGNALGASGGAGVSSSAAGLGEGGKQAVFQGQARSLGGPAALSTAPPRTAAAIAAEARAQGSGGRTVPAISGSGKQAGDTS